MAPPDRKLRTGDPATNVALEARSVDAGAAASQAPFSGKSVLLRDVALTAAATHVLDHGLGKTPSGWMPLSRRVDDGKLYEVTRDDLHLTLFSSVTGTVDLLVW